MFSENKEQQPLEDALKELVQLEENNGKGSSQFIDALINLAILYRKPGENQDAAKYFKKMLDLFGSGKFYDQAPPLGNALWNYLWSIPVEVFDEYFPSLLDVCESALGPKVLDNCLTMAAEIKTSHQKEPYDKKEFWRKVIKLRDERCGSKNAALIVPLLHLQRICEELNEPNESETISSQISDILESLDTEAAASCQISICLLFIQQDQFNRAEVAWRKATQYRPTDISELLARAFVDLIKTYRDKGRKQDVENIQKFLLNACTESALPIVDGMLEKYIDDYINSGNLLMVKELLETRLQASSRYPREQAAHKWRQRLSECYLAMGANEDSQRLFQALLTTLTGPAHKELINGRINLLERLGRRGEAEEMRRRYLK